jgi:hypothetical protein
MQQKDLAPVTVTVEDTWNQERNDETRRAFIAKRLAAKSLNDIELVVE